MKPSEVSGAIIQRGREVLAIEREAIELLEGRIDESFARAVALLRKSRGKVVVTGVGKSGIIAQKIVATFNSTGTPAFYLHPSDALHGDLGMVQRGDVIIILSKSGDTPELSQLLPALGKLDVGIVAMTGGSRSQLARMASVTLDCSIEREACPFDLAPTASTTAMLALGDALAVVLYEQKGFTRDDFAATHPGGLLGRRLLLRLEDIMKRGDDIPEVSPKDGFDAVLVEMSRKRLGATLVVRRRKLLGIITDGDLRRMLERRVDLYSMSAGEMMTADPMTAPSSMLGTTALAILEENKRTQLPVVDTRGGLRGIVHLHDLIEAGLKQ